MQLIARNRAWDGANGPAMTIAAEGGRDLRGSPGFSHGSQHPCRFRERSTLFSSRFTSPQIYEPTRGSLPTHSATPCVSLRSTILTRSRGFSRMICFTYAQMSWPHASVPPRNRKTRASRLTPSTDAAAILRPSTKAAFPSSGAPCTVFNRSGRFCAGNTPWPTGDLHSPAGNVNSCVSVSLGNLPTIRWISPRPIAVRDRPPLLFGCELMRSDVSRTKASSVGHSESRLGSGFGSGLVRVLILAPAQAQAPVRARARAREQRPQRTAAPRDA